MSEARDLILDLMSRDELTQTDIARQLGRSPDMVRLIRQGKRPGNNLVTALETLRDTGTVPPTKRPPRRRRKDGKLAAIRGPVGDWTPAKKGEKATPRPTVVPEDPTDQSPRAKARRFRYSEEQTTNFQGGVRKHSFTTPRHKDKRGRERPDSKGVAQMDKDVRSRLRSIARSQAAKNRINPATGKERGPKRVKLRAKFADGTSTEFYGKNGRDASSLLRAINASGSVQNWIEEEAQKAPKHGKRGSAPPLDQPVVGLEATEFYGSDEKGGTAAHRARSING